MAIVNFIGFESGDTEEVTALTGTGSIQSTTKRTGTYAFEANPTTVASGYVQLGIPGANGVLAAPNLATTVMQFYFRFATAPASASEEILAIGDVGGNGKFTIRLTSAGKLQIYGDGSSTGDTQIGSDGATTLSSGTWYRIWLSIGTGASAAYSVSINGVSEFSGTATLGSGNTSQIMVGKFINKNGQTVDYFYDDIVVADASFTDQEYAIKTIIPTANGSTMSWNAGTGLSDYLEVDEIPTSDVDYVQCPTTGAPNVALFAMQNTGTVGITGTIASLKLVARTRENTSVTSANLVRIQSGSSNTDSTTLNGTTTIAVRNLLANTDPATGAAWTTSGVDAVEMGSVENNAVADRLTSVLGMVLYTPAAASSTTPIVPNLLLMGVG